MAGKRGRPWGSASADRLARLDRIFSILDSRKRPITTSQIHALIGGPGIQTIRLDLRRMEGEKRVVRLPGIRRERTGPKEDQWTVVG